MLKQVVVAKHVAKTVVAKHAIVTEHVVEICCCKTFCCKTLYKWSWIDFQSFFRQVSMDIATYYIEMIIFEPTNALSTYIISTQFSYRIICNQRSSIYLIIKIRIASCNLYGGDTIYVCTYLRVHILLFDGSFVTLLGIFVLL